MSDTTPLEQGQEAVPVENQRFVVGDRTVYNSVEDLYKGAIEKEKYITTLHSELKELKETVAMLQREAKVVDTLKDLQNKTTQKEDITTQMSHLDADEVKKIALQTLQAQRVAEVSENNLKDCKEVLSNFKDSDTVVENKAKELGISSEDLWNIGKKSPKAFKEILGGGSNQASFVEGYAPVTQVKEDVKDLLKTVAGCRVLYERAKKDPSILNDLGW